MERAVGRRLKKLRERQRLDIYEVAGYLDVPTACVKSYEEGKKMPRQEIKDKYAKLFGKNREEIFKVRGWQRIIS